MSALLSSEAVAVYITFFLTSIAWLVARYQSRRRPSLVRVSREQTASLLEIPDRLRQSIEVLYKGRSVSAVHQTRLRIVNRGEATIDSVSLHLPHSGRVIEVSVDDPIGSSRSVVVEVADTEIRLAAEFIDPLRPLRDGLSLVILSEGELQLAKCSGGGKGWRSEYVDQVGLRSNVATLLANAEPRNPIWLLQYLMSSLDVVRGLLP